MDKAYNWQHMASLTINQYILTIELSETNHQLKATNSILYKIVECSSYAMLCFFVVFFYNDANPVHNQRITPSIMLQSKNKNILSKKNIV